MPTPRQVIRSVGGHEESLFETKYGSLKEAPEYLHNYLDVRQQIFAPFLLHKGNSERPPVLKPFSMEAFLKPPK